MTARRLNAGIGRCMEHCLETGEEPVEFVLHKFVEVSEAELREYIDRGERMLRGEEAVDREAMGLYRAAKKWEEFKTFFWFEQVRKDPRLATFAKFKLEQAQAKEGGSITVRVEGVGGKEAFE